MKRPSRQTDAGPTRARQLPRVRFRDSSVQCRWAARHFGVSISGANTF